MKKVIKNSIVLLATILMITACDDNKRRPNLQYMPNMYEPVGYEPYAENHMFADGMASRKPVAGTVARGQELPFEYPNTLDGYAAAKVSLKNPLDSTKIDYKKGKKLFDIYCAACHGVKGDGQGVLVKREKFLGVPNYKDRDITEGSIYHVIMYGKNMMGSHASQLTEEERWQVVAYVQKLRNN